MTDAEAVATLESLRKRKRSDLKEGLVQAVMVQAGSFEDKIRRIEMIDLLPDEPARGADPPSPRRSAPRGALIRPPRVSRPEEPVTIPAVDPALAEPKRVEHYRRKLALIPVRGGLWAYLTREFEALVQFGARTSTLTRGLIPFTLRLSPEALAFLAQTLHRQVLPPLAQTLPIVLKKSWLHLTKFEYNLLAALHDLVRLAGSIRVADGDKTGGGPVWDVTIPMVRLWRTAPELIDRTEQAWNLAVTKLGFPEKVRVAGATSLRFLLEDRTDGLSFPDVLLALMMLRSRRLLSWEERASEAGEYFLKDGFDCAPEVQLEIDRAVDLLEEQLDVMIREWTEIRRIRYYLPTADLLGEFDNGGGRDDKIRWASSFLPRLDASFSPLLEGLVVLADNSQTKLFENPSLSSILSRLRVLEGQLADPLQANSDLVASTAKVVMNLGKTLVVLIRNRSLTADPLARASSSETLTDPFPNETAILDRPVPWAGLSVIDALIKAARICLQVGRFLGETSLETSIEKEKTLPVRAEELLVRVGRLVAPARMEGIRARWKTQTNLE